MQGPLSSSQLTSSFSSIVIAVQYGRTVFDNLKKVNSGPLR
jgi:hypothetical protein